MLDLNKEERIPFTPFLRHRKRSIDYPIVIRESLYLIATMTVHALEKIWDRVGLTPDEQTVQLSDLVERVGQVCEMKAHEEEAMLSQLMKEIIEFRAEWEKLCALLGW